MTVALDVLSSFDSIEGLLVVCLAVFLIFLLVRKAFHIAIWCAGLLVLIQIGYLLGQTSLNNVIPFATVFQYDVFTAVAHLFVGTAIGDGFQVVLNWFTDVFTNFGDTLYGFLDVLKQVSVF